VARLNVPATKTTFFSIREGLAFATEGFDLLDEKRQILVLELMGRVEAARRVQKEVDDHMKAAFAALREAVLERGLAAMEAESAGISVRHDVRLSEHRVVGMDIPSVAVESAEPGLQFSFAGSSARSDEVMFAFNKALDVIARLAEVENAVVRLARELKKTQRRVNALEKIFIPDYKDTLAYVTSVLDERDRDDLTIMKMVKDRRTAASRGPDNVRK